MVSVNTLGRPDWQLASPGSISSIFSARHNMGEHDTFRRFETHQEPTEFLNIPAHRQWPWRGFAFSSDLGTLGCLVNKPQLAGLGWLIALPYYLYSVFSQSKGQKRKEEIMYQATANGLLPFVEAKAGTMAGELLYRKLALRLIEKAPTIIFSRLTRPMAKTFGGLTALLVLTPTLGDPISHWIIKRYKTSFEEGQPA